MILHIPHASKAIPAEFRGQILLDDADLNDELTRMTDAYTDELFALPGALPIVFPVSRLIMDVERFPDDREEPMAAVGMGAIYTRTSGGITMRRAMSQTEKTEMMAKYYEPHHDRLSTAVKSELDAFSRALIIDCHSFPSRPMPCDQDQFIPRPDFCLGTSSHTPACLVSAATIIIRKLGFSFAIDRPYTGTIVPLEAYLKDKRVVSIMIEVNRRLYMIEESGNKNERFTVMQCVINKILSALQLYHTTEIGCAGDQ